VLNEENMREYRCRLVSLTSHLRRRTREGRQQDAALEILSE